MIATSGTNTGKDTLCLNQSETAAAHGIPVGYAPRMPDTMRTLMFDLEYRSRLKPTWSKFIQNGPDLTFGSRMRVLWKEDVDMAVAAGEKKPVSWVTEHKADSVTIVSLPGSDASHKDPFEFGIVWCPHPGGSDNPQWVTLWRMLTLDALHSIVFDSSEYLDGDSDGV